MISLMLSMLLVAQAPQKTTLPGATNVTKVDATVVCGGATTPAAFPELKKLGFKSIVAGTLATCMTGALVGVLWTA